MERRYPLKPLATALGITLGQRGGHQPGQAPTGITALHEATGCSVRSLQEYNQRGMTWLQADRMACAAWFHPFDIWPDWLDDIEVPGDDVDLWAPERGSAMSDARAA